MKEEARNSDIPEEAPALARAEGWDAGLEGQKPEDHLWDDPACRAAYREGYRKGVVDRGIPNPF